MFVALDETAREVSERQVLAGGLRERVRAAAAANGYMINYTLFAGI
jgi:hypothetical protein